MEFFLNHNHLKNEVKTLYEKDIIFQAGMESYQGQGSYEPSADELIDVLKNLENLAAANPALYKAIVDQISGTFKKLFLISDLFLPHVLFISTFYPWQCVMIKTKILLVRAHIKIFSVLHH